LREQEDVRISQVGRACLANFFTVRLRNSEYYSYRMEVYPEVDARSLRRSLLRKKLATLPFLFDGQNLVILSKKLASSEDNPDNASYEDVSGVRYKVSLRHVRNVNSSSPSELQRQVLALVVDSAVSKLKLQKIGKSFFDPETRIDVHEHNMRIFTGFEATILGGKGGVFLQADLIHKIINTSTVLNMMEDIARRMPNRGAAYEEEVKKAVIGKIVLTDYNQKSYRVTDVDFSKGVRDTFPRRINKEGETEATSFCQYYSEVYKRHITDFRQPLLVCTRRKSSLFLVPELCLLTGMTDAMRSDFKVMKAVAQHTNKAPLMRLKQIYEMVEKLKSSKDAQSVLNEWGMDITGDWAQVRGRALPGQSITFAGGKSVEVDTRRVNWKDSLTKSVFSGDVQRIAKWAFVTTKQLLDEGVANLVLDRMTEDGSGLGVEFRQDRLSLFIVEGRGSAEDFQETIRSMLTREHEVEPFDVVVALLPDNNKVRYRTVKRELAHLEIVSQCCVAKQMKKDFGKLRSVTTNILLQIRAKLGKPLWKVNNVRDSCAVIGLSIHRSLNSGRTRLGMAGSIDAGMSQYFSIAHEPEPGSTINDSLPAVVALAAHQYSAGNDGIVPRTMVVFREGVSEAELEILKHEEVPEMQKGFALTYEDVRPEDYPKLVVVCLLRGKKTRLFQVDNGRADNPTSGFVVDDVITDSANSEFYLTSQGSCPGTLSPVRYRVVYNDPHSGMSLQDIEKLAYQLTHMYYNFAGTVKMPAPVLYASRCLSFHDDCAIPYSEDSKLMDKLYYL